MKHLHRQGDLNITGNITLSAGNYDNIYQLPQIVIFVDGNVNISSNVTQIDAWIIASSSSTINTCSDFQVGVTEADAVGRSSNTCTNQLVFNGPVMAGRLALNRSFGNLWLTRISTLTRKGTPKSAYEAPPPPDSTLPPGSLPLSGPAPHSDPLRQGSASHPCRLHLD